MSGEIRDATLWREGQDQIEWAARFMPVTSRIAAEMRVSGVGDGLRIGLVLVLEPKTANLALQLAEAGMDVSVMCGASSTRDDTAAALARSGIRVFARSDATEAQDRELALQFLDERPEILVDDGSSVTRLLHTDRPGLMSSMIGATEETTSGLRPLRIMEREGSLHIPVIAVNDALCKTRFDNAHGTGQSTLLTTLDVLRTPIATAHVVVAGFGPVGRGFARSAAALGAHVTISEVDPVAALEATFAGYAVAPLSAAAKTADLLVSATGIAHTIDVEHLLALPDGAAVAVAGGVSQEVALEAVLSAGAQRTPAGTDVETFALPNGRRILVLDNGNCINCSAGEGNPIDIMDLSFGVQLSAIEFLADRGHAILPGVHPLPREADDRVARAKLESLGIQIDAPSAAQREFLESWRRPVAPGSAS